MIRLYLFFIFLIFRKLEAGRLFTMLSKEERMAWLLNADQRVQDTIINLGSQTQMLSGARQVLCMREVCQAKMRAAGENLPLHCIPGKHDPAKTRPRNFCYVFLKFLMFNLLIFKCWQLFFWKHCMWSVSCIWPISQTVCKPLTAHNNFMLEANPLTTIILIRNIIIKFIWVLILADLSTIFESLNKYEKVAW